MFDILNLQGIQTDNSLPNVVDVLLDDGAPHQNIVEQEEMSSLAPLFISLNEKTLSKKESGTIVERGSRCSKAVLNHLNSVSGF